MSKQEEIPREARLKIVLPTGDAYERNVTGAESHIGRGSHNEILIIDPEVSTTHAMLAYYGDSYFILDEGGEGGTFVNGEKVTKPRKLSHGDRIKIGKSQITFTLKASAEALEAQLAQAASADAAVKTVETEASTEGKGPEEEKKKKHKKDKDKTDEQADSVAAAKASSNDPESEEEKKKKKLKKEKDKLSADGRIKAARVRAWGGIIATVLSVVLTVTISILVTRQGSTPPSVQVVGAGAQSSKKLAGLSDAKKISGGKFEASGAVAVPEANGILFVDDSEPDKVFFLPVTELGEQGGPVKAIPLGVSVDNPEGISRFGSRYIIIGSLSTKESNDLGGSATFDFDPATQTVSKVVALTGLRKFLLDNVPELKPWADKTSVEGGLNVEGTTVDPNPDHPRVLLGLRGPLLNGNALVVPIRIRDRQAPLSLENLAMDGPNAIQLNLNGQAIRDIQYNSRLKSFMIISGAPETEPKTDFALWEWSGEANQTSEEARPKMQTLLDKKMKPEGISHMKISNQEFVFIVGDAGSYAKIDYISP